MSGQGYHFAIDHQQADALMACRDALEVLDFAEPLIDAFPGGGGCGGYKEWDGGTTRLRLLTARSPDDFVGSNAVKRPNPHRHAAIAYGEMLAIRRDQHKAHPTVVRQGGERLPCRHDP